MNFGCSLFDHMLRFENHRYCTSIYHPPSSNTEDLSKHGQIECFEKCVEEKCSCRGGRVAVQQPRTPWMT